MRDSQIRFIRQQGFTTPNPDITLYRALMLQPKIIGALVAFGALLQSPWFFAVLSTALWWGAIVPTLNVFDALYNYTVAYRRGLPPLGTAPAPRRFAQGMAGMFALAVALALFAQAMTAALIIEGVFIIASISVVLRDFCVPAHLYHLMRRTSPDTLAINQSRG